MFHFVNSALDHDPSDPDILFHLALTQAYARQVKKKFNIIIMDAIVIFIVVFSYVINLSVICKFFLAIFG